MFPSPPLPISPSPPPNFPCHQPPRPYTLPPMEHAAGDDLSILQRYAHERDEKAFALLVRRYVDLVYSAAVRRVGDRHLAEDVTQAVFVILAQKANTIRGGPLSAWLLSTVRYAAANALKMENRRRQHEHAAATSAGYTG